MGDVDKKSDNENDQRATSNFTGLRQRSETQDPKLMAMTPRHLHEMTVEVDSKGIGSLAADSKPTKS